MKNRSVQIAFLASLLVASCVVLADDSGDRESEWLPPPVPRENLPDAPATAQELLDECRAKMPRNPVKLAGWVRYRRPGGIVDKECNFAALLRWGDEVPSVHYEFTDGAGKLLSQVTFRHATTPTEVVYEIGPEREPAEPPAWNESILGMDVTWLDISLDFLHWENATITGEATVRGRLCDLVEIYPPNPLPGCAKVRLWVDREIKMFLQAQQVDENKLIRRQMWVRSVKKMGETWMVQDIEVQTRNGGHRTRVHVLSCE